ncbi:MAG TPA: sialidase family protein [Thermoanaerobaculia bacterium]|nr:sialidase family protein [Thermoanaerobaculia bacterium]
MSMLSTRRRPAAALPRASWLAAAILLTLTPSGAARAAGADALDVPHGAPPELREADPRERAKYWRERMGNVTPERLREIVASARRLKAADSLPASGVAREEGKALVPGGSWRAMGPKPIMVQGWTYAGRVTSIAVDPVVPLTLFAGGANGGVWLSTDGGGTWQPMSNEGSQPSLAIGSIAVDPTNHNVVYAGTGDPDQLNGPRPGAGVIKSTDGGATWSLPVADSCGTAPTQRLLASTAGTLWLACSAGLFRSTDGAATWTRLNGANSGFAGRTPVRDVAASADGHLLYAAVAGIGLYRSTNSGASWAQVATGLPAASAWSYRARIAIAPSNSNVAYVVLDTVNEDVAGSIYFTADGGNTWAPTATNSVAGTTYGGYNLDIAVDPFSPGLVYVAALNLTYTTGGTTGGGWNQVASAVQGHVDQHAIAFPPCSASPCSLYLGNDGGIFYLPGGESASFANSLNGGLTLAQFEGGDLGIDFLSDTRALGGTQDNGAEVFVYGTGSSPLEWDVRLFNNWFTDAGFSYLGQTAADRSLAYSEPQTYPSGATFSCADFCSGPWESGDGAASFSPLAASLQGHGGSFYPFYTVDRGNEQHLALGVDFNVYEYTPSTGWYASSGPVFASTPTAIAIAPCAGNVIHGAFYSDEYTTTGGNAGLQSTWVHGKGLPGAATSTTNGMQINSITVDCSDPLLNSGLAYLTGTLLPCSTTCAASGPLAVFKTTNTGRRWSNISGNLPQGLPVYSVVTYLAGTTRVLVIGTEAGVYFSTNEGTTWTQGNSGLPNVAVTGLALDGDHAAIAAFTYGRGAFYANLTGGPNPF